MLETFLVLVLGGLLGHAVGEVVEPGPRRRAFRAYRAAWRRDPLRTGDAVLREELVGRRVLGHPTNLEAPTMRAWLDAWERSLPPRQARRHVRRQRLGDA